MSKVLENSLGNLEYLMTALTLLGVIYLCYKRSGLRINWSVKTSTSTVNPPPSTAKPVLPPPSTVNPLPSTVKPPPAVTPVKPCMPMYIPQPIYTSCSLSIPVRRYHLNAQSAQTADSPFDDSRVYNTTYDIPTIVQEPKMLSDGHIIDSIDRF